MTEKSEKIYLLLGSLGKPFFDCILSNRVKNVIDVSSRNFEFIFLGSKSALENFAKIEKMS